MRYLLNRRIFETIVETENLVSDIIGFSATRFDSIELKFSLI
jgi:hypothetical protein